MKSIAIIVAAAGLLAAGTASAQDAAAIAQKSGCTTCHAVDTKKMGPALKDIAAKYKGNAAAEATIIAAFTGGKPPHKADKISADDAKVVAKWILAM